ncbi:MAG: hypothetical protein RI894_977, partial [Bacteroidota bacterium]
MKTNFIKFVIAFVLLTSLTIVGCTKDPEYPLPVFGDPAEGIAGVWKLSTIKQSDLVIKAAVKPQIDLTDFLTKGTAVSIAFDKMAKTYQVTGSLRVNYLGSNGTFAFNDAKNPTKLLLTDISNKVYSLD